MENLIKKLTNAILQEMPGASVNFERISSGRHCGTVVWDGFLGLDHLLRLERIEKAMSSTLSDNEKLKLSHIATLTKAEAIRLPVQKDRVKAKIKKAIASRFKGAKLDLDRYAERSLMGTLVWKGFRNWDSDHRQHELRTTLAKSLTSDEQQQVKLLLALTPAESSSMNEEFPVEDF